jgi:serine/threonine-protein kinase
MQNAEILSHLERVLTSTTFQNGGRSGALLRYLVETTVNGKGGDLKEYTLGADALGRGEAFDPRSDSIVRVEASRLRSRLELYYATEGQTEPVRITLPKGSYKPVFAAAAPAAPAAKDHSLLWKAATVLALAVAGVAAWAPWRTAPPANLPLRLELDLGPHASLRSSQVGSASVILSPDGTRLVFISYRDDGIPRLMTRRLDQAASAESIELRETEGVRGPFFSPDSKWIAFMAGGKLKKVQVDGGVPVTLCDSDELQGGTWAEDGSIIAALTITGLWRVAPDGTRAPLPGFPPELAARWPQMLPGGQAVLFSEPATAASQAISVFSLATHTVKRIQAGGTYARYLPTGQLAFVEQGTLFVAPFDPGRLELTGPSLAILNDVAFAQGFDSAEYDVSASGSLVYRRDASRGRYVVQWLDAAGRTTPLLSEPGVYTWPRISPDGTQLLLTRGGAQQRVLQAYEWSTGRTTPLTDGSDFAASTVWTPDSRLLVTAHPANGLQWMPSDGTGTAQTLLAPGNVLRIPWSFNPAGDRLAFYQRGSSTGSVTFDLWTVPVHRTGNVLSAGTPEPFLTTAAFETYPTFSPDGRWLAYTSLKNGTYEVYVRAFPDDGHEWPLSVGGGADPHWSGNRIFYRSLDRHVMVADFTVHGSTFQADRPRQWSPATLADTGVMPSFDVAPDGRIAAFLPAPQTGEPQDHRHVTLLLNALR